MSAQSKSQLVAQALFGMGLLAGLGVAQLVWLSRGDRIGELFVSMIGPLIGVMIGVQIVAKQDKKTKPHPMIWHASFGAIVTAAWLVFVAAIYGGLEANALVPTVILSIAGTAMMVVAVPLLWPDSLSKDTSRDA